MKNVDKIPNINKIPNVDKIPNVNKITNVDKIQNEAKIQNVDNIPVPPIRSEFSDFGPNSDFFEPNSPNLV